ncbi:MAG: flagellar basal body-associated FliL family protein [Deltaproteobacteria bacterium]|nr:flagellar basal body-associated FliL family protein [Deltaproteobacteria bacterium]MBN2673063.1 flagellar basal body-associated FliL family protein [Deltaproteobacteria bacterium]
MANEEKEAIEQPKSKKGLIIAVVAIVNVIVIGGAFFFLTQNKDEGKEQAPQRQSREGRQGTASGPIIDLEGFVVNLNTGREKRYLKTKMSLQLFSDEDVPEFDKRRSIVRNEILLQLSSIETESVQSIEGKRELEKTLAAKVNERLDMDRVANVYFTEFVTQ